VFGSSLSNTQQFTGSVSVTGSFNSAQDIVVNGVDIGEGGGSIATNTRIGTGALSSNTTGANNVAVGYTALRSNTTASNNTAVGYQAGYSNTTGTVLTAIGRFALYSNTTGADNTSVGASSLYANTTGASNVATGISALQSNTTGSNNTAIGREALVANTTASNNVSIGFNSGLSNVTGANNTYVGVGAGYYCTGSKNTILGNFNGNQSGLDISSSANYIVLSDGDGNPRVVATGGSVFLGCTSEPNDSVNGFGTSSAYTIMSASGGTVLYVNRNTNDGVLVEFRQANSAEGNISVSGSTVSYNGGHLSRWSQLPDGSKDDTILKGTVLTNLDDMCVWEKDGVVADNEQLNKMKVSDVEGDTNVAGVFVNWTIDEQYGVDDMNVAMTGDMIIRIAQGVVVQKGDLLMSAGDGTAKPQGDDIRRSKTVAKVTSNHVTCTYADGSYCVPCVLMAC
jgi:hypothetical protein